jgi:hypothetical protein
MEKLAQLLDEALKATEETLAERKRGKIGRIPESGLLSLIRAIKQRRDEAGKEMLEPSNGRVILGLNREVADWGEPFESPLAQAIYQAENYYTTNT